MKLAGDLLYLTLDVIVQGRVALGDKHGVPVAHDLALCQ